MECNHPKEPQSAAAAAAGDDDGDDSAAAAAAFARLDFARLVSLRSSKLNFVEFRGGEGCVLNQKTAFNVNRLYIPHCGVILSLV